MPELLSQLLINFCGSESPEALVSNNMIEGKEALFNGHKMKYQYYPNLKDPAQENIKMLLRNRNKRKDTACSWPRMTVYLRM